jgi:hypothetical protein
VASAVFKICGAGRGALTSFIAGVRTAERATRRWIGREVFQQWL